MRRAILAAFAAALSLSLSGAWAEPNPDAANWAAYKAKFIAPDGRLYDESQESVSHSEGQGYGLVLAAFNDDPETFARLWAWTKGHLEIRGDHLAAWRWRPGDTPHVLDQNNATDGDLLIAWGLAEGGRRWSQPDYTADARAIALAIAKAAVFRTTFGPALRPGVAGFGDDDVADGPLVNLSYWVFPAFDALAEIAPEVDWKGLRHSGLALYDIAQFGALRLPTDWISLRGGVAPADKRPPVFGYELIRAPLYLAWGPPEARPRLAALMQNWLGASGGAPMVVDVARAAVTQSFGDTGYRAIAALARCALTGEPFPSEFRKVEAERYYSATLHMLSLTALRVRYPQC